MVTTDHEVAATQPFGLPIARSPGACALVSKATGILHDIRAFAGQACRQAEIPRHFTDSSVRFPSWW